MKHLLTLLACLCLASCASDIEPYTPAPAPPTGSYIITQRGENGEALHQYEVEAYHHNFFGPSVTFTENGRIVTLKGSFDVTEKQ